MFAKCDRNGNATLDRQEIQWGLKEAGIVLSPSEFERVFKFFDKNNDGVVSFPEFVSSIRGPLSREKAKTINAIADKYFTTSEPVITKDFFEKNFDFSAYGDIKSGKKTKQQVLSDMVSQFDHVSKNGTITKADWLDMLHNKAS